MEHPGEAVGPEACAKTAQTSTCIHTKRRVALYRFGHSSVPCRQRPIPHPAGPSIADFEETQPSHMQAQWSPRKPIGRTPNVILAKSCAHQEAARRSIKNSTISDSIVRGRALTRREGNFLRRRWFTGRAGANQPDGCGTGFVPGHAETVRTYPAPASTEAAASAWPSPSGARAALKRSKNAFEVDFANALTRREPSCAILPRIWTSTS